MVPEEHRYACYVTLHNIFQRIIASPRLDKVRKLKSSNATFKERVGQFPEAVGILLVGGFQEGKSMTTKPPFREEPTFTFTAPLDSDHKHTNQFFRVYSLLVEILQDPERWIGVGPNTEISKVPDSYATTLPDEDNKGYAATVDPSTGRLTREAIAARAEARLKNPRLGEQLLKSNDPTIRPNPGVVRLRIKRSPAETAQQLMARVTRKSKHFTLTDIENMRIRPSEDKSAKVE